jgi:hypothetical protein
MCWFLFSVCWCPVVGIPQHAVLQAVTHPVYPRCSTPGCALHCTVALRPHSNAVLQALLELPVALQDAVVARAVIRDPVPLASVLPRPSLLDPIRVPSSAVATPLLSHLPITLHPAVARAYARGGELYLPMRDLSAAGVSALAAQLSAGTPVTAATLPHQPGGLTPHATHQAEGIYPPQYVVPAARPPQPVLAPTVDISPLLAPLSGLTRLTIQAACPQPGESALAAPLRLQQLRHLDIAYSSAHFAEALLPLAPRALRLLNVDGLVGGTAETAAAIARLTDLRVLSAEELRTDAVDSFIGMLRALRQLRFVNAAEWPVSTNQQAQQIAVIRWELPNVQHVEFAKSFQHVVGVDTEPKPEFASSAWPPRLREIDASGFTAEAQQMALTFTVTSLTALRAAHIQVLGVAPTLAGALFARRVRDMPSLRHLSLAGFAACSEAALQVAAAATALTFLDLSAPLNKLQAAPLDAYVTQLASLKHLRVLRAATTDWRAQGVSAAAFADAFAGMDLHEVWIGVPGGPGQLEWVRDALAGAPATLRRLRFCGLLHGAASGFLLDEASVEAQPSVQDLSPAQLRDVTDVMRAVCDGAGLPRFTQLEWLVVCEGFLRGGGLWDGATFGLAHGSHVVHARDTPCVYLPRGSITMWDDHPKDMQRLYRVYAASADEDE